VGFVRVWNHCCAAAAHGAVAKLVAKHWIVMSSFAFVCGSAAVCYSSTGAVAIRVAE